MPRRSVGDDDSVAQAERRPHVSTRSSEISSAALRHGIARNTLSIDVVPEPGGRVLVPSHQGFTPDLPYRGDQIAEHGVGVERILVGSVFKRSGYGSREENASKQGALLLIQSEPILL
jgi:hypothetical protein